MSYILEALRKADAERDRGSVPDLQSQLLPGSPADEEPVRRARSVGWWPGLAVGVIGLGALLFWFFGAAPQPSGSATVAGALPAGSAPMAAASVGAGTAAATATAAAAAAVPASAPPSGPEAAKPPQAAETPRPRKPSAAAAKATPTPPAKAAATKERRPAAPTAPAAPAAGAAPAPPPSAPATLVLRLNELPEDLRRQVPKLVVGGSIYSPQADKRMVIFNGQVFSEGAMLTPELRLEQIREKSAVLSIRGQRFELPL